MPTRPSLLAEVHPYISFLDLRFDFYFSRENVFKELSVSSGLMKERRRHYRRLKNFPSDRAKCDSIVTAELFGGAARGLHRAPIAAANPAVHGFRNK